MKRLAFFLWGGFLIHLLPAGPVVFQFKSFAFQVIHIKLHIAVLSMVMCHSGAEQLAEMRCIQFAAGNRLNRTLRILLEIAARGIHILPLPDDDMQAVTVNRSKRLPAVITEVVHPAFVSQPRYLVFQIEACVIIFVDGYSRFLLRFVFLVKCFFEFTEVEVFLAGTEGISDHGAELLRIHRLAERCEGLPAFPIIGIGGKDSTVGAMDTQFGVFATVIAGNEEIECIGFFDIIAEVVFIAIDNHVEYLVLIVVLFTSAFFFAIPAELNAFFLIPYLSRLKACQLIYLAFQLIYLPIVAVVDSGREQQAEMLGIVLPAGNRGAAVFRILAELLTLILYIKRVMDIRHRLAALQDNRHRFMTITPKAVYLTLVAQAQSVGFERQEPRVIIPDDIGGLLCFRIRRRFRLSLFLFCGLGLGLRFRYRASVGRHRLWWLREKRLLTFV